MPPLHEVLHLAHDHRRLAAAGPRYHEVAVLVGDDGVSLLGIERLAAVDVGEQRVAQFELALLVAPVPGLAEGRVLAAFRYAVDQPDVFAGLHDFPGQLRDCREGRLGGCEQ